MSARELWRRLLFLCRRNRMTEDLEEEMRLHTELRANRLSEQGIDSRGAFYTAQRLVGGKLLLEEWSRANVGVDVVGTSSARSPFRSANAAQIYDDVQYGGDCDVRAGAGANALMFKAIITSLGRMRSTYCLKTCVMSCA
jgi:hypothetical protein